jgi:hypothetical protein
MPKELFVLGHIIGTPAAIAAASACKDELLVYLFRHVRGDWGSLSAEDNAANERAVTEGTRILSAYHLKNGTKIWIITEADRSATTVLLAEEY